MKLTEDKILEYAKKIFGFAYSKTNDFTKAEDLSQEILAVLCQKKANQEDIEYMDAYIYRVCCYTWSKYLRKNKPHWNAMNNEPDLALAFFEDKTEDTIIEQELYLKLRQEIMYLSFLRREIIIRFYYDNQSGEEIAKALKIPASTLRWHLRQTKFDLKERIEMTESTGIYKPIVLNVGHSGWTSDYTMSGLQTDVLTQNLCYVCYGKPKTIEEIARTLSVAAVYLEGKLKKMIDMDYIKKIGQNKYQTNFFIEDKDYIIAKGKFQMEHLSSLSKMYYNTVKNALSEVKAINFMGSDMDDDELIWYILPYFITIKTSQIDEQILKELELEHQCPLRKDGTRHWVSASISNVFDSNDKIIKYLIDSGCVGIKSRSVGNTNSLQYDLTLFGGWRDFECDELEMIARIVTIIKSGEMPNEFDKGIIAKLVEKGYVAVKNNKTKLLIPYLTNAEQTSLWECLNKSSKKYFDEKKVFELFKEYTKYIDKYIPNFIDPNERKHILTSLSPQPKIIYSLYQNGMLKPPTEEQKKRFCTIIFEK